MKLTAIAFTLLFIAGPTMAFPDDLEDAFQNLKNAESKKDAAVLKKTAVETYAVVHKEMTAPAPERDADKEYWKQRVAYARNIELQTDYALFSTAIQSPPAVTVDLLSTLEAQNPKSKYLDEGYSRYIIALQQTGAAAKVPVMAEKALAHFPENEDLLLVLANDAMARRQTDRELAFSERLVAAMSRHAKPDGYSVADWERKKKNALARGYWMCGMAHAEKQQYFEADKDLRAALPLIAGDAASQAPAYFQLGLANYQLGKMTNNKQRVLEGLKFSEQAAAMKGPFAEQAWRNAQLMRAEAGRMR